MTREAEDNRVYSIDNMFAELHQLWSERPCPLDLLAQAGVLKTGCSGAGCPCGANAESPRLTSE